MMDRYSTTLVIITYHEKLEILPLFVGRVMSTPHHIMIIYKRKQVSVTYLIFLRIFLEGLVFNLSLTLDIKGIGKNTKQKITKRKGAAL